MALDEIFERFAKESPLPVMVRGSLEWALADESMNRLFAETAQRQCVSDLAFSTLLNLMSMVVAKTRKSMHAAYQAHQESIQVSVRSVYNKLNGVEPVVSAELVRRTARFLRRGASPDGWRTSAAAAGVSRADPRRQSPGSHRASLERTANIAGRSVAGPGSGGARSANQTDGGGLSLRGWSHPGAQHSAGSDRGFTAGRSLDRRPQLCTSLFLFEIALNQSYFIIREHATNVRYETVGHQRLVGRSDSGQVFEQSIRILNDFGDVIEARRVTVKLDHATEDGDWGNPHSHEPSQHDRRG